MNLLDQLLQNNGMTAQTSTVEPGMGVGSLSPGAYDRALSALGGYGMSTLGKLGMNTVQSLAMGMPTDMLGQSIVGSVMSPGSVLGAFSAPMSAALGVAPEGFMSKAMSMGLPAVAGLIGGPVAGLATGVLGNFAIDGLMDAMNARPEEAVRDRYESDWGYAPGHAAFADRKAINTPAAAVREALPNSIAAIQAMDEANRKVQAMEAAMHNRFGTTNPNLSAADLAPSYGGINSIGGPMGGLAGIGSAYGPSMGGWAGLGIGNPSSYGGRNAGGNQDAGGFGANDGNSDTAGNAGYGR